MSSHANILRDLIIMRLVLFKIDLINETSAIKRINAINRIQNKGFCLHNKCVFVMRLIVWQH